MAGCRGILLTTILTQVAICQETVPLENFGLLVPTRSVFVAKGKVQQQVQIFVPAFADLTAYKEQLNSLDAIVTALKEIPGLARNTPQYREVGHILKNIGDSSQLIAAFLGFIHNYYEKDKPAKQGSSCSMNYPEISPTTLAQVVRQVNNLKSKIKLTATSEELAANDNQMLMDTLDHLTKIQEVISDEAEILRARLTTLEELTNKIISGNTLVAIQSRSCVLNGDIEESKLMDCIKSGTGLACTVSISHTINEVTVTLYTPVVYSKVRLSGNHPSQFIVKGESWALLSCEEDLKNPELDSYDFCHYTPIINECSRALDKQDISELTKHCNLIFTDEEEVIFTDYGILVPEKYTSIKILGAPDRIILDKPPLIIRTAGNISLTGEGQEIIIKPPTMFSSEKVIKSWLTEEDKAKLVRSAKISKFVGEIDGPEIADFVFFLLLTIIIPIVAFLCKHAVRPTVFYQVNEDKMRKKENLETNKALIKHGHV